METKIFNYTVGVLALIFVAILLFFQAPKMNEDKVVVSVETEIIENTPTPNSQPQVIEDNNGEPLEVN